MICGPLLPSSEKREAVGLQEHCGEKETFAAVDIYRACLGEQPPVWIVKLTIFDVTICHLELEVLI